MSDLTFSERGTHEMQAEVVRLREENERLANHLEGVNAVLAGNRVSDIAGEIRDQAWRVAKLEALHSKIRALEATLEEADDVIQADNDLVGALRHEVKGLESRLAQAREALISYREKFTAQTLVGSYGTKDVTSIPRIVHDQLLDALRALEEPK